MKKRFKLLAVFLLANSFLFAQEEKEEHISKGQNTIYYEYYGISGSPYSIHYDRIIVKNLKSYINASIGLGTYSNDKEKFFSIPLSFNVTTGIKKHHFEFGMAVTYRKLEKLQSETELIKKDWIWGPKIGYKFQAKNKVFFKLNVNLMNKKEDNDLFFDLETLDYLIGLGLGYSF